MKEWILDYPENANFADYTTDAVEIHATAVVSEKAILDVGVRIGPYAIVGPKVVLEKGVHLGSHVVMGGRTTAGEGTRIFPFASIGTKPQNLKYEGDEAGLVIGPRNTIREHTDIEVSAQKGSKTVIGSGNFIMAFSHIAHDCVIGDGCILANGVNLAGHVYAGDGAFLGGMSGVHQFCRIGELVMVTGGSMVNQNIPPFCVAQGYRARVVGLNFVGLKRAGFETDRIREIKKMFRLLYREGLTLRSAIARIEGDLPPSDAKTMFLEFLKSSQRGISR